MPPQRPQVRATLKNPCWNVTWPAPPHAEQGVGVVPGALPRAQLETLLKQAEADAKKVAEAKK